MFSTFASIYSIWWFYLSIGSICFTGGRLQFQAGCVVAAACVADSPCSMLHMWLHAASVLSLWLLGSSSSFSTCFFLLMRLWQNLLNIFPGAKFRSNATSDKLGVNSCVDDLVHKPCLFFQVYD